MLRYKRAIILLPVFIFFCLGIVVVGRINYKKTHGFSISVIQFDIPYNEKWNVKPLSHKKREQLDRILTQRFTYLDKGARSYAFVSEDGMYVLKFFKYRYHKPHWTVRYLPQVQPFEYFRQKKLNKVSLDTVLTGYKNAYTYDPEGTGMVYVHLNPSVDSYPVVTVKDRVGKTHRVDLGKTRFVLQRKAVELSEVLDELLKRNEVSLAKERLAQTFELYHRHFENGLYDLGTGVIRNNGFIGDKPVHFDVGKLTVDSRILIPEYQRRVMSQLLDNADIWLLENYPQHREEIVSELQRRLNRIYGIQT